MALLKKMLLLKMPEPGKIYHGIFLPTAGVLCIPQDAQTCVASSGV